MPILCVQLEGATSSTSRQSSTGRAASGALITPTVEGVNVIAAGFDVKNRDVLRRVLVCVEVLADAPSASGFDDWDTVEEVDIDVPGPLEVRDLYGNRITALSLAISGVPGSIRLRAAARGRAGFDPVVHIVLWPSDNPAGLVQLRHTDGVDLTNFGSQAIPSERDRQDATSEADERTVPMVANLSSTESVPLEVAWQHFVDASRALPDAALHSSLGEARWRPIGDDEKTTIESWFGLADSLDAETRRSLLPGLDVLTFSESTELRKMLVQLWGEALTDEDIVNSLVAAVPAYRFIPEYVPLAERDGLVLVVDTRKGQFSGCVTLFDKVDADAAGPMFRSINALLTDLATALDDADSRLFRARATSDDGQLRWEVP